MTLTPDQLRSFSNDGFVVLANFISPQACRRLQLAADSWVNAGLEIRKAGEPLFHHTYLPRSGQIVDIEQLHRYGKIDALELAGAPEMCEVIEQLCGPEAIWIYEGLHIHTPSAPVDTPWMQDAVFEIAHDQTEDDLFAAGANCVLYLDMVPEGEHGYYFLPGSHHQKQDVCALRDERGWDTKGLSFPQVQEGDLLIYHPMLAHSFLADCPREDVDHANEWQVRTLKLWYRTPKVAMKDFSTEWLEKRKRLSGLAGWVNAKLKEQSEISEDPEREIERRANLYERIKDDLLDAYEGNVVYPSAHFCLDFKTGDRISGG